MTMVHAYAAYAFGLWLPEDEADAFRAAYVADPGTDVPEQGDRDAEFEDVTYAEGGVWLGGSEYDGVTVEPLAGDERAVEDAGGLLLPSERQGSVLASDAGSLYRDASEMARELEGRFGRWLPAGLDVASHLAGVSYTYCG